jgi:hypothetical protein
MTLGRQIGVSECTADDFAVMCALAADLAGDEAITPAAPTVSAPLANAIAHGTSECANTAAAEHTEPVAVAQQGANAHLHQQHYQTTAAPLHHGRLQDHATVNTHQESVSRLPPQQRQQHHHHHHHEEEQQHQSQSQRSQSQQSLQPRVTGSGRRQRQLAARRGQFWSASSSVVDDTDPSSRCHPADGNQAPQLCKQRQQEAGDEADSGPCCEEGTNERCDEPAADVYALTARHRHQAALQKRHTAPWRLRQGELMRWGSHLVATRPPQHPTAVSNERALTVLAGESSQNWKQEAAGSPRPSRRPFQLVSR